MSRCEKYIRNTDLLFYIAFGIYVFVQVLSSTLYSAIYNINALRILCFFAVALLVSVKLIMEESDGSIILYVVLICGLFFVGLHVTNMRDLLILGFLTIGARNVDFRSVVKLDIWIISLLLLITVISFYLGVFDSIDTSAIRTNGISMRYSLGFGWTTYAPNLFFTVAIGMLYLNPQGEKKWMAVITVLLINGFLYKMTDTRAVYYEVILLAAMYLVASTIYIDYSKHSIISTLLTLMFVICALVAIYCSYYYDSNNTIMNTINRITTNRLYLGNKAFELYDITLWGNKVEWNTVTAYGNDYFYVDSSYVQLLLQYGIITLLYVIILLTALMKHYINSNNSIAIVCLVIIALHSITDPQLFSVVYNPFLLSLGMILKERQMRPYFIISGGLV